MDEHSNDPYEQQLYAVFQSCLTKGETELQEDNWLNLCHKLHLTERSEELKSCIQRQKKEKQSISFQEFRTALLMLLGKTQEKDTTTESQCDISSSTIDNRRSSLLTSINLKSNVDFLNIKPGMTVDENRLKCLWEKINICLKENVDSATMYFISNCLGIPALPKQIIQCIFEKLDQNCDGLINLEEFVIIFQSRTPIEDQLTLDKNNECTKELTKLELKKRNIDIHASRKASFTRNTTFLDTWKLSSIANTSLLMDGGLKTSEISLSDLTATLCDELKNFNDSLDHTAIRSHIMLLRDVLILYQEELHSLNLVVENINGEKEKLRTDVIEANERANTLAQEIDEQHIRQEEVIQNLRKQIEQRHAETLQDLSNQLSSEREMSAVALKSKDEQIQISQKENHDIRNKFVNALQENQVLETENENLRDQIEKLKQSNTELLTQIKMLAAEHDESQTIEVKHQQEVIYLVDRIKQLQSEAVLLRDQNDELTAELESLKSYDGHVKDVRQNNLVGTHAKNTQLEKTENSKETLVVDEDDLDVFFKHSTPTSYNSNEDDTMQSCKKTDLKNFKDTVIKQLKNVLVSNNKCTSENCLLKNDISEIITRLQSNLYSQTGKEIDFVKSIASEMETECEERTSGSLRDFVVPKHKNSVSIKRTIMSNNNDNIYDIDNLNNREIKNLSQNKTLSLRDYPPRKEECTSVDHSKCSKEKDISFIQCMKISNELNGKVNSSLTRNESPEDVASLNLKLQELEAVHVAEKKQLIDQCTELERSLELLKIEYEECEDYWTAKLEEERQLFEQEQKISDEKFSELIAKMAEYEELISPVDRIKNGGRLSPIEEKFNLEQQYLDLEEEFEKWKAQMEEDICRKDKEIKDLHEKLNSFKRPIMVDISVQVTNEFIFSSLLAQSNYVSGDSFNELHIQPCNESSSTLVQCSDSIHKLPEEFKFNGVLESASLSNNFNSKEDTDISNCDPYKMHLQHSIKNVNSKCKIEKPGLQWKLTDISKKLEKKEICDAAYDIVQNTLKLQNLKIPNCQCMRNDAQVCCVNVNTLRNLSMKLQTQERKRHQLQECFKQQQYHIEHVLQRIISQHQVEVSELQCLLRDTQERLQVEFQTSAEQAEQLARTDILVKDLYIENACLAANLKRLQQHYQILTGLNAESTSI